MEKYLKNYRVRIRTLAPVFVGDGKKIGKREYIYLMDRASVLIPDLKKMYEELSRRKLAGAYQEYMLSEEYPLGTFLRKQGFSRADYFRWMSYELDAGDYFDPSGRTDGRGSRPKEILRCIKDPYGNPYLPGSSIKGMLRTTLLAWIVRNDRARYSRQLQQIRQANGGRRRTLKKETEDLEQHAFHQLSRKEEMQDAVNSIMSGLIVSDSNFLKTSDLTLAQKVDYSIDGDIKRLPILREALKPDVEIVFDLTIDPSIFPYSIEDLQDALKQFNESYFDSFGKHFGRGNPAPGIIWIGGGVGFSSKTVIHPLFPEDNFELTDMIMKEMVSKYRDHHHNEDSKRRISPHMYKCTFYQGDLYDMGMAKIDSVREI